MARVVDVEPEGRLVLEDVEGSLRRYMFKEVEYLSTKSTDLLN
jgi:BirA family biotin operon repressor/biotin-[acetyl-CoA-carboxylase] ligase